MALEIGTITNSLCRFLNPFNDIITYFIPKLGVWGSDARAIHRSFKSLNPMMSMQDRAIVIAEVERLAKAAGISRSVQPYVSLNGEPSTFGGCLSFTRPIVVLPQHHLFRNQELGPLGAEKNHRCLENDLWRYTDDEMRFLTIRSLCKIATNDSMLKVIARVVMAAAVILLHFSPMTWQMSLALLIGASAVHFAIERISQERLDRMAVKQLGSDFGNELRAEMAALRVLQKIQMQRRYTRKESFFARFMIHQNGDYRFDFFVPSLNKRIRKLQQMSFRGQNSRGELVFSS